MFYRRKDGILIDKEIHIFNRMFPFLMRTRNESMICHKEPIIMDKTLDFIREHKDENGLSKYNYFDIVVSAAMRTIAMYPMMNRFIMGGHYYQRKKLNAAFIVKTKLTIEDPERNVIVDAEPGDTLEDTRSRMRAAIDEGKNIDTNDQEKAMKMLFKMPTWFVRWITGRIKKWDEKGWLPLSMTDLDALHTSCYIANLGSIGLNDAPQHHLFDWGNCSLFITTGRIKKDLVVSRTGETSVKNVMTVCFSIDERISEGLYYSKVIKTFRRFVENPELMLEPPKLPTK